MKLRPPLSLPLKVLFLADITLDDFAPLPKYYAVRPSWTLGDEAQAPSLSPSRYYAVGAEANGPGVSTFSSVPSTVLTRRRHAALAPARGGARGRAGGTALGAPGDAPGDARADYAAWEASARRPPHRARDMPYGNAGVMLINVPWMRRTYDEFVA